MAFAELAEKEIDDNALLDDEPETEKPRLVYDRDAAQILPLTIIKGDKTYQTKIELAPISDEEWLQVREDSTEAARRSKGGIESLDPLEKLARTKLIARYGYKERSDWRESTKATDLVGAINQIFEVESVIEEKKASSEELLDDDAEIRIELKVGMSAQETRTFIFFREPSKDDLDEYLSINANRPQKGALASAHRVSKERRLFALANKLKTRVENYEQSEVPAWDLVEAVGTLCTLEIARVGKLRAD